MLETRAALLSNSCQLWNLPVYQTPVANVLRNLRCESLGAKRFLFHRSCMGSTFAQLVPIYYDLPGQASC